MLWVVGGWVGGEIEEEGGLSHSPWEVTQMSWRLLMLCMERRVGGWLELYHLIQPPPISPLPHLPATHSSSFELSFSPLSGSHDRTDLAPLVGEKRRGFAVDGWVDGWVGGCDVPGTTCR